MNEDRIKELRCHISSRLQTIDSLIDLDCKYVCLFAFIECFAQSYDRVFNSKNKYKNQEIFQNFLEKFAQQEYSFLNKIDVVTLFYHKRTALAAKGYSLEYLNIESSWNCSPYNVTFVQKSKEIINDNTIMDKDRSNHKYSVLLYRVRNKFSHEFVSHTFNCFYKDSFQEEFPVYWDCSHIKKGDDDMPTYEDEIHLIFPYTFLRNLSEISVKNYLNYCIQERKDPFSDYGNYLSLYERY